MKQFRGVIYLLFAIIIITSPLLITAEASHVPAQISATFSGELLPDPYFSQEPYVEIGGFSPEFDSEYTSTGGAGSVSLIWMHTAGYRPNFDGSYQPECYEYARVSEEIGLDLEVNDTIQAMKISSSIRIDCTGDFATQDILDDMWEVNVRIINPNMYSPYTIKTLSDLQDGDNEEVEFMLSRTEAMSLYHEGSIPQLYTLILELIPCYRFSRTVGNVTPWNDYSGSVKLTIDHMSAVAMLKGEGWAPTRTPKYNTTDPENETSAIFGIESAGYDSIHQFRLTIGEYSYQEYNLLTLSSSHQILRNKSVFQNSVYITPYGLMDFDASNDGIAMLSILVNGSVYNVHIQYLDSLGNSLWNSTENLFHQDIPFLLTFDSSGNLLVFVISVRYGIYPYDMEFIYSLLKLDNQGNSIWNQTILVRSYGEYLYGGGNLRLPFGFGCSGNNIFISLDGNVQKYDSSGNLVWSREFSHSALCVDPQGGCYTYSQRHGTPTELTKWDTNGNVAWTLSLGWDYGSGWIEYPYLNRMMVGPNGLLHLVLVYDRIHTCTVLARVTRTGQLLSQDTILEAKEPYYTHPNQPQVTDFAITGNGLVHIVGSYSNYPIISDPFILQTGTFMLTYELPSIFSFSPISIAMMGVASVLVIGIAYDYFFRRGKVPEPPAEPSISDFEW